MKPKHSTEKGETKMKTNYPKIEIFVDGKYRWSTTRFKTCKGAMLSIFRVYPELISHRVTARFAPNA